MTDEKHTHIGDSQIQLYVVTKNGFKINFGEYVQDNFLFDKDNFTLGVSILYSDIGFIFVDNIVKYVMMFLPKRDIVETDLLCALMNKINTVLVHELIHLCHYPVTDEQIFKLESTIFSYATTLTEYIVNKKEVIKSDGRQTKKQNSKCSIGIEKLCSAANSVFRS